MGSRKKQIVNQLSAVAGIAMPEDRQSISCRKISNGYIVSENGVKSGKYYDKEYYSPKKPNFNIVKTGAKK
jgi:hypothetical protein